MAYTPYFPAIAIGSAAWGTPLNAALANLDRVQESTASDHGLINWNWNPGPNMVATAITSGTVFMVKVWIRQPVTVDSVAVGIGTVGAALVAGQNFAGLYDAGGNRLGQTADQTAAWGTTGGKDMALTAPVVITTPGAYYVAILSNAGTTPAFARGSALVASIVNINLTATDGAYATGPAGQTSLPASITMASRTLTGNAMWAAVG
jgi:hypothetical protein